VQVTLSATLPRGKSVSVWHRHSSNNAAMCRQETPGGSPTEGQVIDLGQHTGISPACWQTSRTPVVRVLAAWLKLG
jgi:hypothetical protein